ncbi:hypothetical protein DAMA08_026210 [Martiniozyma asiatica (nom. inval.)]|nr:hypothetical protein DAMA08_026210 [Martiniozyma asiatica]
MERTLGNLIFELNKKNASIEDISKNLTDLEEVLGGICMQMYKEDRSNRICLNMPETPLKDLFDGYQFKKDEKPGPYTGEWEVPNKEEGNSFGDFVKLQDSFKFNLAQQLIALIERLTGGNLSSDEIKPLGKLKEKLILVTIELLIASLAIHPSSRQLFASTRYMAIIASLFQFEILIAPIIALLPYIIANNSDSIRSFEKEVLKFTCDLLLKDVDKECQLAILELLLVYLTPEENVTTEEKRQLLEEYLDSDFTKQLVDRGI